MARKRFTVDAIKVSPADYLPAAVRAKDGHAYRVLGVVTEQTSCSVPLVEMDGPVFGRRLCVLLGERIPDPPTPEKAVGHIGTGSGA